MTSRIETRVTDETKEPAATAGAATPPEGTRLILASEDLFAFFGTRTEFGDRLTYQWGEPTAEGWYEPRLTSHRDDEWLPENEAVVRLRRIEAAAQFPRNATIHDGTEHSWTGEWVAVPAEDFAALRSALTSSTPEKP